MKHAHASIMKTVVLILSFGLPVLSGCGTGGVDSVPGGSGGGGGGDTAAMTVNQLTVTPSSVAVGKSMAVHWNVSYSTPATGYSAEFHINNQPSLITGLSALTRVFYANGDLGGSTVGKDATISCTYSTLYGVPTLNCGTYGYRYIDTFDLTKPMYGILKACTYDTSMKQVCAEKSVPLSFVTSAAKEAPPEETTASEPAGEQLPPGVSSQETPPQSATPAAW
ncbi:MAG TPA: hypothetical protein HPP94_15015 [Desulfuromonadales bacterium]|nr:hypothetical protein [Desulfuromonadales bacterium]